MTKGSAKRCQKALDYTMYRDHVTALMCVCACVGVSGDGLDKMCGDVTKPATAFAEKHPRSYGRWWVKRYSCVVVSGLVVPSPSPFLSGSVL
jgi:hypothetical protein